MSEFAIITEAFAQSTPASPILGGGFEVIQFLPWIAIFVLFYFLLIRPQNKRMKEHREMINHLKRGDRVVTGGGIVGTVDKVLGETELAIEIAEGVKVRVLKSTISNLLTKTGSVTSIKASADTEGEKDTVVQAKNSEKTNTKKGSGTTAVSKSKAKSPLKKTSGNK